MLKKLLKYDLKNSYKVVVIFYILAVAGAAISRLMSLSDSVIIGDILKGFFAGFAISMSFSILINSLMNSWVYFIRNVYGDESYLTHTLPVGKNKIYMSKVLSTIIMMLTSVVVILITVAIAFYSKYNIGQLKNMLLFTAEIFDSTMINLILVFFVVFFLEMVFLYLSGLAGIIIAHKFNNHKTFKSFIFGFVIYTIFILFMLLVFAFTGYLQLSTFNVEQIKSILGIGIVLYSISSIGAYIIGNYAFNKGVDVI